MTDDFQLFAESGDHEGPIDSDVALVSAYLARELSPLQVLGVEERLATDVAFRTAMQPLLDAWAAPVPSLAGAAHHAPPLTALEQVESWRRYSQDAATAASVIPIPKRKISMSRIAAVIGLAALPMLSFAQAVSYAARHTDAPGHAFAQRIVAALGTESRSAQPGRAGKGPSGEDMPVGRQLNTSIDAIGVNAATAAGQSGAPKPDRSRIAELARQHQAAAVRGDTAVEYVLMVLDASDRYVWSTIGNGNLSIEIAGDPRTPSQRAAYNQENMAELWGSSAPAKMLEGLLVNKQLGVAMHDSLGRLTGVRVTPFEQPNPDTAMRRAAEELAVRIASGAGGARGGGPGAGGRGGRGGAARDSVAVLSGMRTQDSMRVSPDSMPRITKKPVIVAGRNGALGGRGGAANIDPANDKPGVYKHGFGGRAGGGISNQASGLQDPSAGQSGIQGLVSSSVAGADLYHFGATELAPQPLLVMVVRLIPGATWRGRQQ